MIPETYTKLIMKQTGMYADLLLQLMKMLIFLLNPFRGWNDHDLGVAYAARAATTVDAAMKTARLRERAYMRLIYKEMGLEFPSDADIGTVWSDDPEAYDEMIGELPRVEDQGNILEGDLVDIDGDGFLGDEVEADDQGGFTFTVAGGVDVYPRNGVTPLDVWQRPMEEYRWSLSTGLSPAKALENALIRTGIMAKTDLSLARRDEIRKIFMATPKVIGYRRIIHPELSQDGTSCGLCIVAADRVYRKRELLPIHNGCNCAVLPITKDQDPGRELNDTDLANLYDAAGDTGRTSLQRVRVSFTEHGEMGPIISRNGDKGKQSKVKEDREILTPLEAVEAQLKVLRKSAEKLRRRARNGEDVSLPLTWQNDRIRVLTQQYLILKGNRL